ncbi:MAG: FHA domain-containing protein [Planctomycetaceae bacterium]
MRLVYLVVRREIEITGVHELHVSKTDIGRSEDCPVRLSDALVSRRHAALNVGEDKCTLCDLGSQNGTYYANARITSEITLGDKDEFRINPYSLTLYFHYADVIQARLLADQSTIPHVDKSSDVDTFPLALSRELTPAQNRVCELLVQGFVEKEVARQLGVSVHTVHVHTKAIYRALGVSTRGELVARWFTNPK